MEISAISPKTSLFRWPRPSIAKSMVIPGRSVAADRAGPIGLEIRKKCEARVQTRLGTVREWVRMWVTRCRLNAGVVEISNYIESGGNRCLGRSAEAEEAHDSQKNGTVHDYSPL
jgi:hypothetical protein